MRRARLFAIVALGLALFTSGAARAAPHWDPSKADAMVADARQGGLDGFCADPPSALRFQPNVLRLCPLASTVPHCERLTDACARAMTDPDLPKWNLGWLGEVGALFVKTTMWFVVAAVPLWLLWLVLGATFRARREKQLAGRPAKPALVVPDPALRVLAEVTDAERLLALAAEHAQRGQLDQATALYLAASLAALDRRGAIRLAKHRTNGEYVRACKDDAAKPELRAIVREVDRVQFGKQAPTAERIAEVASRATTIVRAALVVTTMAALLLGCGPTGASAPAARLEGDELLLALLEKQGATVSRPTHSLSTLPMPTDMDEPAVVVDASRTLLEDEAKLHLVRWVKAGGTLFLFGGVSSWPEELGASSARAQATDVKLRLPASDGDLDDTIADDDTVTYGARLAEPAGMKWKEANERFATTSDDVTYGGVLSLGRGLVIGVASDDLVTNVGLASPPNARAVVGLVARFADSFVVARPEDGVAPPSGPLAALVRAGLGLGLAHAAAAAALLLLASGVRQARAKATPPPARRAWTEHVAATGALYARAKLAPHALATYVKFVDGRLRARMPRGMSDPAAYLAIRSGRDAGHCAEVWARAMASRAGDRVQGDELVTLGELRALYAAALKTE